MEQVFSYIISLGASVMMPIIFTVIGLCIGMKFGKALKSGLFVGVGFVGLGVVTALLTTNFNDPLKAISDIYHLQLNVFDMGWPAAAAVAYNTAVGALIIPICLGVNSGYRSLPARQPVLAFAIVGRYVLPLPNDSAVYKR